MSFNDKKGKKARHIQITHLVMKSDAWTSLKPGPRALYAELRLEYKGFNNGRLMLAHRDAAKRLNVSKNTVGPWFKVLEENGLIRKTKEHSLGIDGDGHTSQWAFTDLKTADGKPATLEFRTWKEN